MSPAFSFRSGSPSSWASSSPSSTCPKTAPGWRCGGVKPPGPYETSSAETRASLAVDLLGDVLLQQRLDLRGIPVLLVLGRREAAGPRCRPEVDRDHGAHQWACLS